MISTVDLVAAVKARQRLSSDAALARLLGMTEKTVARWRTGRNWPDDLTAARLAELAEFDSAEVVAAVHAERARTPEDRALWQQIADRLHHAHAAVLAALAAIVSVWITGDPDGGAALALGALALPVDFAFTGLYIVACWLTWRALKGARLEPIASHA